MEFYKKFLFSLLLFTELSFGCNPCVCVEETSKSNVKAISSKQISILKNIITIQGKNILISLKNLIIITNEKYKRVKEIESREKVNTLYLKKNLNDLNKLEKILVLKIEAELNENKNLTLKEKEIIKNYLKK